MLVRNWDRSDWVADQFLVFEEGAKTFYALWKKLVNIQRSLTAYDLKKSKTLKILTDLELVLEVMKEIYSTSTFERNEIRRKELEQRWDYSLNKFNSNRDKINPLDSLM